MNAWLGYAKTAFRWQRGRQQSGYEKMLLLMMRWPLRFDSYLLRFPEGSSIPVHTDPVASGRHYRLNLVVKSAKVGGDFQCADPIYATARIKFFRPERCAHSVSPVLDGVRYVLSLGWILGAHSDTVEASQAPRKSEDAAEQVH